MGNEIMMAGSIREIKRIPPRMERKFGMNRIRRIAVSLAMAIMALTVFNVSSAMARHQWSNYHWEFPTGESDLTINVNNCQVDVRPLYEYDTGDHFFQPNSDWDGVINFNGADIIVTSIDGCVTDASTNTSDPITSFISNITQYDASPGSAGTINAFNADYGDTGWVGVAIVELAQSSGDNHIVYGEVHLNDYYPANFSIYNSTSVMRKVQCQEVGHVFGLDHIKKDTSCMYSSAVFLGNAFSPDNHDGDMVNTITHSHDATPPGGGGGGGGGGSFCDKNPDHRRCQAAGVFRGKAIWAEGYESRDDMFEAADVVVSARVLNGSMFDRVIGAPGQGLPVSQAVLQIQETFKGNANGVIRVEHVRGLGLEIEDDPGYVNGDDYMLFLRQVGARTFRVVNPQGRIQQ